MTDLNTTSFQETFTSNLQEALKPKKTSILLWTNHSPKYPNSFILKKEGKKYLGLSRTDKKGETYWSFKEISGKRKSENKKENESNANSPE